MPVVLLCHCDGTNGSTTFTDVSPGARTLTASTCTVSTTSPKFGTGSADFSAGSAAALTVSSGTGAEFNFGAAPFTVEAWAYFTTTPAGTQTIASKWGSAGNLGWTFRMASGALAFFYSTTGSDSPSISAAFTPTLNTWYHLAADRDASNTLRIYVNGVVIASGAAAVTLAPQSGSCIIGNEPTGTRGFPGRLDEVRIINDLAQYGGAFTPPTGPFTTAAFTTWSTTDKSASLTLTGGNLIATSGLNAQGVRGAHPKRTGRYYVEYTSTTTQNAGSMVGFATAATLLITGQAASAIQFAANTTRAYDYFGNTSVSGSAGGFTTGSVVCCAIDLDAALVWFRTGAAGNWNGNAANNPATGVGGLNISAAGLGRGIDAYPYALMGQTSNSVTANFGGSAFTGAVPAGFTSGWDDSVSIVTNMVATQAVMEQWGSGVPEMWATQVLIEHWASVADAAPVVPSADTRVMVLA